MKRQTFARELWLSLLASFACSTAIAGFDAWLLRQAHRTAWVPGFGPLGQAGFSLADTRPIDYHHPIAVTGFKAAMRHSSSCFVLTSFSARGGKTNMFDAEIAATLLNRWEFKRANPGDQSPLDLLREGKLHFKHEGGHIRTDDPAAERRLRVECLTFTDDSRALRVTDADGQGGWSRWTAAEPIRKSQMSACKDHVDRP
jgi:hypothetical protein